MHIRKFLYLVLVFSLALSACTGNSAIGISQGKTTNPPTTKIRLPVGYIPSVQFAPFYVAIEKGYFLEEGLEIDFDYSFETDAVTLVGHENIPFAVVSGEQVLLARAQGLPVVYVMTYYKDYPVSIVSKAEKNLRTPQDLIGKKIGTPILAGASYIGLRALLKKANIREDQITLDVIGYNQVEALALDHEDAAVCYTNNEPIQLEQQGYDLNILKVSDAVLLASNGVITNEAMVHKNPDLVRRMLRATLRGMRSTLEDPKMAYEVSKKYIENLAKSTPQQEKTQKEILRATLDLWRSDPLGKTNPEAWENMQDILLDMGLLTKKMDINDAYTNEFIK